MITVDSWFPYKQHTINVSCPKNIANVGLRLWCNALALLRAGHLAGEQVGQENWYFPSVWHFWDSIWNPAAGLGCLRTARVQWGAGQDSQGLEHTTHGELSLFNLEKWRLRRACNQCYTAWRKGYRTHGATSLQKCTVKRQGAINTRCSKRNFSWT